jgi:hypothetical protein
MTSDEWSQAPHLFGLVLDDGTPDASIFGVPVRWTGAVAVLDAARLAEPENRR